jgi:hypothetical protein
VADPQRWLGNREGSVHHSGGKMQRDQGYPWGLSLQNQEITLALGALGVAYALWRTRMRSQESHEMVF